MSNIKMIAHGAVKRFLESEECTMRDVEVLRHALDNWCQRTGISVGDTVRVKTEKLNVENMDEIRMGIESQEMHLISGEYKVEYISSTIGQFYNMPNDSFVGLKVPEFHECVLDFPISWVEKV